MRERIIEYPFFFICLFVFMMVLFTEKKRIISANFNCSEKQVEGAKFVFRMRRHRKRKIAIYLVYYSIS